MSMNDTDLTERLGRALARKAENRDGFIGSAFAHWRDQHGRALEEHLCCSPEAVWRLAVTPKPTPDDQFVERVMQLAISHGANPTQLVKLLRWSETVSSMRRAGVGTGLLKAALDAKPEEPQ